MIRAYKTDRKSAKSLMLASLEPLASGIHFDFLFFSNDIMECDLNYWLIAKKYRKKMQLTV